MIRVDRVTKVTKGKINNWSREKQRCKIETSDCRRRRTRGT